MAVSRLSGSSSVASKITMRVGAHRLLASGKAGQRCGVPIRGVYNCPRPPPNPARCACFVPMGLLQCLCPYVEGLNSLPDDDAQVDRRQANGQCPRNRETRQTKTAAQRHCIGHQV